ncbi:MAG: phage tail protein [Chloroflexi bacterium]|nr:phage tail protein [Chloroflexota bacterium]MBP8056368.1 phage tail protein [Chloroflexota bacterium]
MSNTFDVYPGFRFVVTISDITGAVFTECTLPTIEWDLQEVKEGGLNSYVHQLPGLRKATKITLKRGLVKEGLLDWYMAMMSGDFTSARRAVTITLMNSMREPVMSWNIVGAYPTKWTGPQLKSDDNTIAVETLELACGEVTVVRH